MFFFFRPISGSPVSEPGRFSGNFHTICGTSHTETSTNIMELPGARLSREILGHFRLQYGVVRCIVGSRGVSRSPGSLPGLPVGAPRMCVLFSNDCDIFKPGLNGWFQNGIVGSQ